MLCHYDSSLAPIKLTRGFASGTQPKPQLQPLVLAPDLKIILPNKLEQQIALRSGPSDRLDNVANYSQLLRSFGELSAELVDLGQCIMLSGSSSSQWRRQQLSQQAESGQAQYQLASGRQFRVWPGQQCSLAPVARRNSQQCSSPGNLAREFNADFALAAQAQVRPSSSASSMADMAAFHHAPFQQARERHFQPSRPSWMRLEERLARDQLEMEQLRAASETDRPTLEEEDEAEAEAEAETLQAVELDPVWTKVSPLDEPSCWLLGAFGPLERPEPRAEGQNKGEKTTARQDGEYAPTTAAATISPSRLSAIQARLAASAAQPTNALHRGDACKALAHFRPDKYRMTR